MKAAQLYYRDFAEWAWQNAELLRSGHSSEADLEHIAEEIEDMGKRERNPSFRPALPQIVAQAYEDAMAVLGAIIADSRIEFPGACPYSIDQLLDEQFSVNRIKPL